MSNQVCFHVCICFCFFVLVFVLQMSPIKKKATKKSSKHPHTSIIWWEKGEAWAPRGSSWWTTQEKGLLAYHWVHPGNMSFGLHHDLQPLSGEELDNFVNTKDNILIWSLHSQGDRHLWSHLSHFHQKLHKDECKANSTIPKPCHVSYFKGKGEDSKWASSHAKGRLY